MVTPAAIATTFFKAPASSTPRRSSLGVGRKPGLASSSGQVTAPASGRPRRCVTAVGRPRATSIAKEGPDGPRSRHQAARPQRPRSDAARSPAPGPWRRSPAAPGRRQAAADSRSRCAGTASNKASASARAGQRRYGLHLVRQRHARQIAGHSREAPPSPRSCLRHAPTERPGARRARRRWRVPYPRSRPRQPLSAPDVVSNGTLALPADQGTAALPCLDDEMHHPTRP